LLSNKAGEGMIPATRRLCLYVSAVVSFAFHIDGGKSCSPLPEGIYEAIIAI